MKQGVMKLSEGACLTFDLILKNKVMTKADLCHLLNKGISSISRYLMELDETGLILEDGLADSSGGRKPVLYSVSTHRYYICCINISTIYCEVAIIDLGLNVLQIESFSVNRHTMPSDVILQIQSIFENQKRKENLKQEDFLGAGVSVFNAVKNEEGELYHPIIQYLSEDWLDYPFAVALEKALKLTVYLDKGINSAAMLEYNYGKARDCEKIIYILSAMNVRSAMILHGSIQRNSPFYEDAIGHMTIDYDGKKCQCGQYGCLNCYASIPAIVSSVQAAIKQGQTSMLSGDPDRINISAICECAKQGDSLCSQAITSAGYMLGIAIANQINLICPDKVIISGLLSAKSRIYYESVVDSAKKRLAFGGFQNVSFDRGDEFQNALTVGAGAMLLEKVLHNEKRISCFEIEESGFMR
ncbi:MAG: ROK family protein [Lachnospiraceae bacterium]|nr:ROK family protein [Lachnospiraceae bacterium]